MTEENRKAIVSHLYEAASTHDAHAAFLDACADMRGALRAGDYGRRARDLARVFESGKEDTL